MAAAFTTTGAGGKGGASVASLAAPRADGTTVDVPGGVGKVAVAQWVGGGISAAWVNSLATKADKKLLLPGDYEAYLALTGVGAGKGTLAKASIAGSVRNAVWDITGTVASLAVANTVSNWTCSVDGLAGKLAFGAVADSSLAVNGRVASLAATNWMGGSLWAHSVDKLATSGSKTGAVPGHFTPDVQLTGQGVAPGDPTLGSASIADGLALGTWDITGDVGSIAAGFVEDWTLAVHSNVDSFELGAVTGGNITVDGIIDSLAATSWDGGTVTADALNSAEPGFVNELNLTIAGIIDSIESLNWLAGTIQAAALNSLDITGDLKIGVYADFAADLNLTGGAPGNTLGTVDIARRVLGGTWTVVGSIGKVDIFSWLRNCVIRATGNIESLAVGAMDGSTVYAGVADGVTGLPDELADFTNPSTIGKIEIVGIPPTIAPYSFENSFIAANSINSATIREVRTGNGGVPFGIAGANLGSIIWQQGGTKYSWPLKWPGATGDLVVREITA